MDKDQYKRIYLAHLSEANKLEVARLKRQGKLEQELDSKAQMLIETHQHYLNLMKKDDFQAEVAARELTLRDHGIVK